MPIEDQELASETPVSREEKASRLVERIQSQPLPRLYAKFDRNPAQWLALPWDEVPLLGQDELVQFNQKLLQQHGQPVPEVDRRLAENLNRFLAEPSSSTIPDDIGEPAIPLRRRRSSSS
jgi:hypothetical protein